MSASSLQITLNPNVEAIDNNTKVRGAGFRGRPNKASVAPETELLPSQGTVEATSTPAPGMVASAAQTISNMVSTVTSMAYPPNVTMNEDIPAQERHMDNIQARTVSSVLAWLNPQKLIRGCSLFGPDATSVSMHGIPWTTTRDFSRG
jgi:hypothetical protein